MTPEKVAQIYLFSTVTKLLLMLLLACECLKVRAVPDPRCQEQDLHSRYPVNAWRFKPLFLSPSLSLAPEIGAMVNPHSCIHIFTQQQAMRPYYVPGNTKFTETYLVSASERLVMLHGTHSSDMSHTMMGTCPKCCRR